MAIAPAEAHGRAAARFALWARARAVVVALLAAGAMAAGLALFIEAARLMPYAKDVTEPQLVEAQVTFFALPGFALWCLGLWLLAYSAGRAHQRTVIALLVLLPVIALLLAAAPTLVNVCSRDGGACG